MKKHAAAFGIPALFMVVALAACQSAYYGAMEKVGVHKRDIMASRVKDARASQAEAREAFKTTLEQFSEVVEIRSKDLEKTYHRLNKSYEHAAARADQVHDRVDAIESVSRALFREWQAEIKTYASAELKRQSQDRLRESRARYEQMILVMKSAAAQMDPVLAAFRDQVLFLKHNLNSSAIASIQGEVVKVRSDCARLIADMEKAIAEADAFIKSWPGAGE